MAFARQVLALCRKNAIVLSKHWFINLMRCFVLLIGFGIFLGIAQLFLIKPSNLGMGTIEPVKAFSKAFDPAFRLVWADESNGAASPAAADIMEKVTRDFTDAQRRQVIRVDDANAVAQQCPQNFQLYSECFAALIFTSPNATSPTDITYTLRGDAGFFFVDVVRHTSDFEKRVLPLQVAVDHAIIELAGGRSEPLPLPLTLPFTQETNEEQDLRIRLSFVRGFRSLLVLAFFACFLGIVYHLAGSAQSERALGITAHMKVMGLRDSARVISWHISLSAAYLPAWIITALIWRYRIFAATNVGLMIIIHLITGLSLASWTLFASVPFGRSPQLAAVVATFLALLIAILALVAGHVGSGAATLFTLILPPAFFIFATRGLAGWENHQLVANVIKADPDRGIRLLPLIVVGLINIVLFPALAVWWERRLYDAQEPNRRSWAFWRRSTKSEAVTVPDEVDKSMAISIRNLRKVYPGAVVAVNDLSFDVPRGSLFVLLGSNGAGKSTSLSIIAGLLGRTSGSVWRADAEGGAHGRIGIVPQKNVMHPELTCLQTVQLWSAIKSDGSRARETNAELRDLLKECDLEAKINSNCDSMSGGQKRKLQLAIGLVGGSTTVLVDECTSGVDPLSRRAIWRTLNRVRGDVTIVYTTHFLDEGDLLGDHVAILAAPGKLVASDHPVNLKAKLGGDYTAHVAFDTVDSSSIARHEHDLLAVLKPICSDVTTTSSATAHVGFRLGTRDGQLVSQVLNLLETTGRSDHRVRSYDVVGPTLEDVFLNLMLAEEHTRTTSPTAADDEKVTTPAVSEKPDSPTPSLHAAMDGQGLDRTPVPLDLTTGGRISVVRQSLVIVYKRFLVVRRSWLAPLLAILVGVCGCCIPLFFLGNQAKQCGVREVREERMNSTTFRSVRLWLPESNIGYGRPFFPDLQAIIAPPTLPAELGTSLRLVSVNALPDTNSAIQFVKSNYKNVSFGALAFDGDSADAQVTFVWEATAGTSGATLNNLASNILLNRVRPEDDIRLIKAQYAPFTGLGGGPLNSLKWMAFFSAALSVVPAFATLYTARERKANVQAMQRSNGLTNPAALWLGHVIFDAIPGIVIATIVTLVFAFAVDQFHGVGYLWLVLALYSFTGSLLAYCFVQLTSSPLAAFAACAGYQIIMFVLYLASYLLIYTYAKNSKAPDLITITHYTLSLLSPIAPVLRAALVSINLFNLLCSGNGVLESGSLGTIDKFGSPIVYLIGLAALYFSVLVAVDSNFRLAFRRKGARPNNTDGDTRVPEDVLREANDTAANTEAPLRVLHATKSFNPALPPQVDDVSFSVDANVVFALLGPNGAGKSTTFNIIRGEVVQDYGEVSVKDLGVCPQFSALDSLTVREHLQVYGLLKGIPRGPLLRHNVDTIIRAATLLPYADRLASQLSGGNARKLALAIALMGSPPVILVDEFSTGIDPATKRTMWETLRRVTAGKAVVITTHSMEEAAALSTKVGIIARKMLAVGTTESLEARYPIYDVHVACRTREDVQRAKEVFADIPGASQAEDVATRFEVPVGTGDGSMSLARLFELLSKRGGAGLEYAVERTSLETVFLKVIRANRVQEEDTVRKRSPFAWLKRRT